MAADDSHDDRTRSFTVLSAGANIGHYRIVEKIGAGGMGEVYLAEDTSIRRKVALKFLPAHMCEDEDSRARFHREAEATAKLNHPNIVTIFGVSEHEGRPYFAMELVSGQTLGSLAKAENLDFERIVDLTLQICEGLAAAHESGVIHRDIKPNNIVVDEKNRLRLLDFGLAAVKGAEQLTRTGSTMGTVQYMSPEQVQGKELDHRSDLFSLGVVVYELITGRTPFGRDNEAAALNAILQDEPEPLARYKADVPDELQRMVSKLLEKDPSMRYQSAQGVTSDLKRMVSRSQVSVTSPEIVQKKRGPIWFFAGTALVLVIALSYFFAQWMPVATNDSRKMLAVLPFENLGLIEDEYFADGITEEILVNLSQLSGLGVISRSSTNKYKGSDKSLKQIGKELGVDYILKGTIRWDKSSKEERLRINPRLVQVSTDVNLWADRYTVVLDDIFAVQASVARKVAEALDVTLLVTEQEAVTRQPTDDPEAYDYYLRGNQYYDATNDGLRNAEAMYQSAIELEPEFALAYAKLGMVHTQMYWHYHDRSPERLAAAREAVDRSIEIAPDLAEAHFALGWFFYHGDRNYGAALKQFALVARKQPGNSDVIYATAQVQRRQGRWSSAVNNFRQVVLADPRSAWRASEFAGTLVSLREYAEAEMFFDRAISLAPDLRFAHFQKTLMCLVRDGHTENARQVIASALRTNERWAEITYLEIILDMVDSDYDHALEFLSSAGGSSAMIATGTAEYYLQKGDIYRHQGFEDYRRYYDSAIAVLKDQITSGADQYPHYLHLFLGKAYAGLGQKEEAIREGLLAVECLPVSEDAFVGPDLVAVLAEIYCLVGEYDLAIDQLEYLLSIPSWTSAVYVATWPEYAPLRDHPRFKALVTSERSDDSS